MCVAPITITFPFLTQIYTTNEKSKDRKRLALIINNVEFRETDLNRLGAEKDEESMRTLLEALGYDVIVLNDLSAEVCLENKLLIVQNLKHH